MALELGDHVRINAIELAAIDTDMLRAGLKGSVNALTQLERYHPTQSIDKPDEVGRLVSMLVHDEMQFLNGTTIRLDGGIGAHLHDPE